jgi:GR25 family glycosyltransferase involved in LPS biosynthesis
VERISAIDGMKHSFNPKEQKMVKRANYQLSHFNTLKHIIAMNYKYSIILQDDVFLREGFVKFVTDMIVNLLGNSEIVNPSLHKKADGKEFIE